MRCDFGTDSKPVRNLKPQKRYARECGMEAGVKRQDGTRKKVMSTITVYAD